MPFSFMDNVQEDDDACILPNYDAPIYAQDPPTPTSPASSLQPQSSWPPQRTSFEREVAQRAILRPQPQQASNRIKPKPRRTPSQFAMEMLGKAKDKATSPLKHSLVPQQAL